MTQQKPWAIRQLTADEVHGWPLGDLIHHEAVDCVCGPERHAITNRATGRIDGWLIRHHSLDGREQETSDAEDA
ncbi:hypothetical protein IU443_29700 [Nocardia farcinica]|uniref:Uncharacterized protein n=1 Tax=Nocardia farcinica TaxID=37329 RepID=A0A0H5PAP8_NOCFR|nr:hypothetical protein [Nocardia farcinica]SLG33861.1 Uncharacterised protein [Mycobacteroides abscessus subsp. abscessus]AXK88602.1 hypothetical protein DXT66_25935 [Nocardia farcinica]MBF6394106.1 hypothetical protein [Nocardia farcinica]PFW98695.1 hypothetical protein CJ469_05948 [Nocardia farcinica]PFX04353.1 hypothetical protein CJ468_05599 [Nocardia farcinica]